MLYLLQGMSLIKLALELPADKISHALINGIREMNLARLELHCRRGVINELLPRLAGLPIVLLDLKVALRSSPSRANY